MTDYAELALWPDDSGFGSGALLLRGGEHAGDRAFLGCRPGRNAACGILRLYSSQAYEPVQLFTTRRRAGKLLLRSPLSDDDTELFEAVTLASWNTREGIRAGTLELKAVALSHALNVEHEARRVAYLGTDTSGRRGVIEVTSADRALEMHEGFALPTHRSASGHASLGVSERGPFLRLTDPDGTIVEITPHGIHAAPAKVGEWNFVADDPTDETRQIHYAVLEGPEVGVYVRGTATLAAGRATLQLPAHLGHVASERGLTVQLTPRSSSSKGVAATKLTLHELEIAELHDGQGEYQVDYLVQGVRRGHEAFEVSRPRNAGAMRGADVRSLSPDELEDEES